MSETLLKAPVKQYLPGHKIQRLLDYLENVGLDPQRVVTRAGLDMEKVAAAGDSKHLPSIYYALIYKEMVGELEKLGKHPPWAAGLGSQAFRLMCLCMISSKTLGQALGRASEFNEFSFDLCGQQLSVELDNQANCVLHYHVDESFIRRSFSPANWSLEECLSRAQSSGLEMWLGLCGWMIGRKIDPTSAKIAGPALSTPHQDHLRDVFQCLVEFSSETTSFTFDGELLDFRIVHNCDSLREFLDTGPYQLWSTESRLISTTAAVKSLLGTDFSGGIPSFEQMAEHMHMSPSTLRRHLLNENSSYRKIKDERRKDMAIELLCLGDTTISDIGDQVGFCDTSSFVRSFKNWTGVTPKAYREAHG